MPAGASDIDRSPDGCLLEGAIEPTPGFLSSLKSALLERVQHQRNQGALIASLNEVAAAVSSSQSVDDVLGTIVERAKRITTTEKAALVLVRDETAELDFDTLVVRGSRDNHLQSWWEGRLRSIAHRAFQTRRAVRDRDSTQGAVLLCAPIMVRDVPIGLVCGINSISHAFTQQETEFMGVLGAFAASAIENARLAEQNRYVMLAGERDRIARELHDGISQSLFSISLGMEVCKKQIHRDPEVTVERLDELQVHLNSTMGELRRLVYDLRPSQLQDLGLIGAVEAWVKEVTADSRTNGSVSVTGGERPLGPSIEACLYRVVKEATSNAVKHAHASEFIVALHFDSDRVLLEIADDGRGFSLDEVESRPNSMSGVGLRSIKTRVVGARGRLRIDSAPGKGTRLTIEVPVGS